MMPTIVSKLIRFPVEIVEEIKKYQEENYINSFNQAVIQLVRKGLAAK